MSRVFSNEAEEAEFLLSKILEYLQIVALLFSQRYFATFKKYLINY